MRIQIDKSTYVGARPDGVATGWIVTPGSGEMGDDWASYRLEIEHDYSGRPDRITRVAFRDGERFEFDPAIFADLEAGWTAANQFIDFAIAGRS
jgi:hypothetical protein